MRTLVVALLLALPLPVRGQGVQTELAVSGFAGNFGTTTVADFDQGFRMSPAATAFTVTIIRGNQQRVTTVQIAAGAATFGVGKPIGEVQWRRNDQVDWTPLSMIFTAIESRTIQTNGTSWSNSIWVRTLLNWESDPEASRSVAVTLRMLVAAP